MPFRVERRVEFRDTDAAGIVHFSAFFPMMESAEHALLRSLGIPIMPPAVAGGATSETVAEGETAGSGPSGSGPSGSHEIVTWPRVSASCEYRSAARFEDCLTFEVMVTRVGSSSVRYGHRISCGQRLVAEGSMTAVCCRLLPGGGLEKLAIPGWIRQRLTSTPQD